MYGLSSPTTSRWNVRMPLSTKNSFVRGKNGKNYQRGYYFCLTLPPLRGEVSFQTFSKWHGYVLWVCSSKFHGLPCGFATLIVGMMMGAITWCMYLGTEIVLKFLNLFNLLVFQVSPRDSSSLLSHGSFRLVVPRPLLEILFIYYPCGYLLTSFTSADLQAGYYFL